MGCLDAYLDVNETDGNINATIGGKLGYSAVQLLTGLADRVRANARPIRLEVAQDASVEATGLAGFIALEDAAAAAGVTFEIRAQGAHAAELLARAGLARVLCGGP